jgi:hypothetical protein
MIMATLVELAGALYDAKKGENEFKAVRISLEEQIAELVETKENGSKTVDAGEGLKVTVKRALGYKADMDGLIAAARAMDTDVAPIKVVPESLEFDEKVYENLREENPGLFSEFAKHVTVTPKKVSVTLKLA